LKYLLQFIKFTKKISPYAVCAAADRSTPIEGRHAESALSKLQTCPWNL